MTWYESAIAIMVAIGAPVTWALHRTRKPVAPPAEARTLTIGAHVKMRLIENPPVVWVYGRIYSFVHDKGVNKVMVMIDDDPTRSTWQCEPQNLQLIPASVFQEDGRAGYRDSAVKETETP